jgi:hypothetical protein
MPFRFIVDKSEAIRARAVLWLIARLLGHARFRILGANSRPEQLKASKMARFVTCTPADAIPQAHASGRANIRSEIAPIQFQCNIKTRKRFPFASLYVLRECRRRLGPRSRPAALARRRVARRRARTTAARLHADDRRRRPHWEGGRGPLSFGPAHAISRTAARRPARGPPFLPCAYGWRARGHAMPVMPCR